MPYRNKIIFELHTEIKLDFQFRVQFIKFQHVHFQFVLCQYCFSCPFWAASIPFMVDTIKYHFTNYNPGTNFLNETPDYLENASIHRYSNEDVAITGYLGILRITVRKNTIIIENSLCKWYLGNNVQTLTFEEIKLANELLSDLLHINILEANILRLDIGQNYILQHDPSLYFDNLGKLNRYRRLEQSNGLYYRTNNTELAFYNKLKELKVKRENIPEHSQDVNLLRYELRLLHNLSKILKQNHVTAGMLSNKTFYDQLVQNYSDMYFKINKIKDINLNIGEMKGVRGMENAGVALLIDQYGENAILRQIKNDFALGKISEKEKRGMLGKINHLKLNSNILIDSDIIKELDKKINSININ